MKQLTTFVTLCRTLNYQKAAEQLQYAPSTLFKHIQLLEQEVGATLVRKEGRGLSLTEQGEAFLPHAQNMQREYQRALESVSAKAEMDGTLNVGGCEINTGHSLLPLFERFLAAHPKLRLSMTTTHNAGVASLVRSNMLDVGFIYSTQSTEVSGLRAIPLLYEPVHVMAAREHPLVGRHGLGCDALSGLPFAYPHDTCCFVSELFDRLVERGVALGQVTFLGSVPLVAEHVRRSGGVTLVPHCAVSRYEMEYGMACLDVAHLPIRAWNMAVYKSFESLRPAGRVLIRLAKEYAAQLAADDPCLSLPKEE